MTTASENAQKVIAAAKKFSDAQTPYVYGAKGEMLCKGTKSTVESLRNLYCDSVYGGNGKGYSHILGNTTTNNGKNWKWTLDKATTDQRMIDCSGLTAAAYKDGMGKYVGAGSWGQYDQAKAQGVPYLSASQAQPGDLLWRKGHVAIMGNGGNVIEAKGWKHGCVEGQSSKNDFTYTLRFTGGSTTGASAPKTTTSNGSLSSAQVQSAVTYNKKNNQSICKQIQGLVGVTQDGSFGPITVNAIAAWQAKNGLDPDGKFGPASKAKANLDGSQADAAAAQAAQTTTAQPAAQSSTKITLTSAQQQAAIKYNKNKNQSICRQIQALVGVSQDGSFGPITVNAIANWQSQNGLEADGMFGPASQAKSGIKASAGTANYNSGDGYPAVATNNIQPIYNYLMSNVFSGHPAAKALSCGMLGNIYTESHYQPGAEQNPGNAKKGGKGIVQWDDRKYNLFNFCGASYNEKGKWAVLDKQLQFIKHELEGSEGTAYKRMKNCVSSNSISAARTAALNIATNYERCAVPTNPERQDKAEENYRSLT